MLPVQESLSRLVWDRTWDRLRRFSLTRPGYDAPGDPAIRRMADFPAYPCGQFQISEETLKPVLESPAPRGRRIAVPVVLSLLALASLVALPCHAKVPAAQRTALVALYNST